MRKGKYLKKASFNAKPLMMLVALVLVVGITVGGTLAWLTATSETVTNTFTTSDIGVTLQESDNLDLKMIPGWTITKDPKAAVTTGSEKAWLFVKIVESANFDEFMTYAIAAGWETVVAETANEDGTKYTVIGKKVDGTTNVFGTEYSVLKDDQVTVKDDVTKKMMQAEDFTQPTLTFTAYAVQLMKNNTTEFTAAEAWALAQNLETN